MAKNNFAAVINAAKDSAYKQGHLDGMRQTMDLDILTFTIAMSNQLGIGENRLNKVLSEYFKLLGDDFVSDPELTRTRMERRFEQIVGKPFYETIVHVKEGAA